METNSQLIPLENPIVGERVEWMYESRKGWGYRWWVPAVVIRVGPKRITIDAEFVNGGEKRRIAVNPERLRRPQNKGEM